MNQPVAGVARTSPGPVVGAGHLFLPPVLFALGILLTSAMRLRVRVPTEPASPA